ARRRVPRPRRRTRRSCSTGRGHRRGSSSTRATRRWKLTACAGRSRPSSSAPAMAEVTRPATGDDVTTLARLLEEEGRRWALIGAYAIAAHGFVRLSEDIDILVDPSRENTGRWIKALAKLPDGATRDLAGEEDLFERQGPYAVRVNDEFTIDVMPS